jgi:hypothetical protein
MINHPERSALFVNPYPELDDTVRNSFIAVNGDADPALTTYVLGRLTATLANKGPEFTLPGGDIAYLDVHYPTRLANKFDIEVDVRGNAIANLLIARSVPSDTQVRVSRSGATSTYRSQRKDETRLHVTADLEDRPFYNKLIATHKSREVANNNRTLTEYCFVNLGIDKIIELLDRVDGNS